MNRIRNEIRRAASRPGAPLDSGIEAQGTSPVDAAIGVEARERYEAALGRLSENDRDAIIARIELGMTYQEIATALQRPSADATRGGCARAGAAVTRDGPCLRRPSRATGARLGRRDAIDWAAAESSAASEAERQQIRDLRIVGRMASRSHIVAPAPIDPRADWGPLRIIEPIGHGRFGDVYRAWDRRLDREVALKLLRRPESEDRDAGSGVVEEGRLLARVRHPNVVTVYGAERINGRVGVWMELVARQDARGRSGERTVAGRGRRGHRRRRGARARGRPRGRPHPSRRQGAERDARRHRASRADGLRDRTGSRFERAPELAGTPLYLAPEVLDGAAATPRSDVYSVGVLVFHLATGTFPIDGRTVGELRSAHRSGDRTSLDAVRRGIDCRRSRP